MGGQKYFTHGPRGPRPQGATSRRWLFLRLCRFSDFAAFPALLHIPGIFATFPPYKSFGAQFLQSPFPQIPARFPARIRPAGPNFLLGTDKIDRKSRKKWHGSVQKTVLSSSGTGTSAPLAPGGDLPRNRGRKSPFHVHFGPLGAYPIQGALDSGIR